MSLKLDIRETSGVAIIDLSGRITLGDGTGELREALGGLKSTGHRQILLNLADVSFLDSSGIGVLIGAYATITNGGGKLKLMHLSSRVKDVLLVTKLYTVFEVFDDEAPAIASFTELETPATRG